MNDRLLTIVTFLPVAGLVVLLAAGRGLSDAKVRATALATSLATFGVSLVVLARFDRAAEGYQLVEQVDWVRSSGLSYLLGVDGISVWLVLLTTFLFPVSILASWTIGTDVRRYMGAMLALETAVLGSFLALDLLLFFLFFEAILVPMYLLIGGWGGERRLHAAIKFFLFTMAGSAFLLVATLFLYAQASDALGQGTFDLRELRAVAGALPVETARWLFLGFFVAFAVKVPIVPLHTWLPDAHTEAPTAGSVLLAGVLLKVGTYGLLRFNLALFPEASRYFATAVSVLAVIGIVYGAVCALIQIDVKRLVAYSSVSHLGFVVLGMFAFTQQGVTGSVAQMVNHGLATGALFLLVGMIYERTHTRRLDEMGGLATPMPWLLGSLLFAMLASVGLPGLNSFVGEFLIVVGTFAVSYVAGGGGAHRGGARRDLPAVVLPAGRAWSGAARAQHAARRDRPRGVRARARPRAAARARRRALDRDPGRRSRRRPGRSPAWPPTAPWTSARRGSTRSPWTRWGRARDPRDPAPAGPARADPRRDGDRRAPRRGVRDQVTACAPPGDRDRGPRRGRGRRRAAVELERRGDRPRRDGPGGPVRRVRARRAPPGGARGLPVRSRGRAARSRADPGRGLPLDPPGDLRDDADRGGERPDRHLPRPGDPVALALRPHRHHGHGSRDRVRDEVLPAGRVLLGVLPVRRRDGLRRGGQHEDRSDRAGALGTDGIAGARVARRGLPLDRVRLQGVCGAVPHVDPRRLPGRADAGHRVHVRGHEGGGVLRPHPRAPGRLPGLRRGIGSPSCTRWRRCR